MVKRELEWLGFVLLASGVASFLAFRGVTRAFIDFSVDGTALEFSPASLFITLFSVLLLANGLFAWMVRLARRDVGKTRFLKRFFGVVSMVAVGAALAMGVRSLPAFGVAGYEELANGSVAAVVVLLAMVLMAMFRTRELPVTGR